MEQPYSSTDMAIAKNFRFILAERSDFHMVDKLPIVVHALPIHMLTSLSVDEILLPNYIDWSQHQKVSEWLYYTIGN